MDQTPVGRNGLAFLVGLGFLGAGLFLVSWGLSDLYGGYRSNAWPPAPGVTLRSEVRVLVGDAGDDPSYQPEVSYSYRVDRTSYQSQRIKFGGVRASDSRPQAERRIAEYRAGAPVKVHYNPVNPAEAVLEPGSSAGTWSTTVLGALFVVVGSLALAYGLRRQGEVEGAGGRLGTAANLSTTGLDLESPDPDRLVLRERAHPRAALVLAIFGLLLVASGLASAVEDLATYWFVFVGFSVIGILLLIVSVSALIERETVFDRTTRRVLKLHRFYRWSWSTDHDLSRFTSVHREKVTKKEKMGDLDSITFSYEYPVSFKGRDGSPSLRLFDARSGEQARELARIVGEFLGLEQEDGGERLVDKTA